jgi:branched-chain amino acid transport system substrate-binding protein
MSLFLVALTLFPGFAVAAEPATIGIVCELSGPGATVGMNWERGVLMAVEEINGTGGILGRKIETFSLDTKTEAPVSVAAMKKAVERKPFVVMGTVFSGSTIVNMPILQQAGIPQFSGSTAPSLTKQGNLNFFRTSYGTDISMLKVVKWLTEVLKVKKLALIYASTEHGKGGRDALMTLLKPKGVEFVTDIATEMTQTDFTGELARVKTSGADTLFIFQHEDANARILPQVREMGLDKLMRIVGHVTLLTEDVIKLAKESANGIQGHVGESPYAPPLKPIGDKYLNKYRELPDHNFFQAYIGTYVVKAVAEETGGFDQQKFRDYLHNRTLCVKDHPGIRMDLYYDDKGDIDRDSFLVTVQNQKHVITGTLGPLNPEKFQKCKK